MTHHPSPIQALLCDAIRTHGPLTFAAFMDLALYHPLCGYYRHAKIGRAGDFMTSVSSGPVWGRIWARHFRKLLAELEGTSPSPRLRGEGRGEGPSANDEFQPLEDSAPQTSSDWNPCVYEFGGNAGQFRADVLAECTELDYRIIEAHDPLPEKMEGIVFSNELLDALPFHRLRIRDGQWREIMVGLNEADELTEIESDVSPEQMTAFGISDFGFVSDFGFRVSDFEARPRATDWIREVTARLTRGYVITVDYGYTHEEYFAKPRPKGTMRCYHRHTQHDNALANIGEQDITADVDFTSFIAAGEAAGLETILFTDQTRALLEIGREVIEEITTRDAGEFSRERNAIHQLIHPTMMGRRFKVLIQRRASLTTTATFRPVRTQP